MGVAAKSFIKFNALKFVMKRYSLILTSMFILLVFGVSVVLASIATLPPSNPTVEPPGPFISEEQQLKNLQSKIAGETLQRRLERCRELYVGPGLGGVAGGFDYNALQRCNDEALKDYHDSMRAIHRPPQLILPNGNSPGQGN